MGESKVALPVKNLIAVTYNAEIPHETVLLQLKEMFGPVDCSYGPIHFTHTNYYKAEMGDNLFKIYLAYETLVDRSHLSTFKNQTNALELTYAKNGNRLVNIDPGYITNDKLVLASTKDFFHRIYLKDGIYAEVTLHYRKGCYRFFSWTYPDYKEEEFLLFLEKARASYVYSMRQNYNQKEASNA